MGIKLLSLNIFIFTASAWANCGDVTVDCKSHTIKITSPAIDQKVDCGRDTANSNNSQDKTFTGEGTIGGQWTPQVPEDPIKDGVEINSPGMQGTGRIFHTVGGGAEPQGLDNSKGCIHVSSKVLDVLKGCQGSKLSIVNAAGGAPSGGAGGGAGMGGLPMPQIPKQKQNNQPAAPQWYLANPPGSQQTPGVVR